MSLFNMWNIAHFKAIKSNNYLLKNNSYLLTNCTFNIKYTSSIPIQIYYFKFLNIYANLHMIEKPKMDY
jgi:hypothetical protein